MLAMVVNVNAWFLVKRGVLESIASMLAPTGGQGNQKDLLTLATTVALHTSSKPQLLRHWLFDRSVSM
jgi:hypothetical protein